MPPVLPSGEISSTGTWTGETALRSSWIRRLKPSDKPELTNGNSDDSDHEISIVSERAGRPEPLRILELNERVSIGERRESMEEKVEDVESSNPVAPTKPYALCGERSKSNCGNDFSSDASKQIPNKQRDYGADRQSKGLAIGKESVARPFQSGFGPWIKLSSGSRLEEKPSSDAARAELNSKDVFHASGLCSVSKFLIDSQSCKQLGERAKGGANEILRLDNAVPKFSRRGTKALGKPPLPPLRSGPSSRGKLGWSPRPFSQNSKALPVLPDRAAPFSSSEDMPISDREMADSQCTVKAVRPLMSRDGLVVRKVVHTNEEKSSTANLEYGASFRDPQSSKDLSKEHVANDSENGPPYSKVPATHVGDCAVTLEHYRNVSIGKAIPAVEFFSNQSASHSDAKFGKSAAMYPSQSFPHLTKQSNFFERDSLEGKDAAFLKRISSECRHAALEQRPLGSLKAARYTKSVETADLLSKPAVNDLHLRLPNSGRGYPKLVTTAEVVSPTAVSEAKGNTTQPSPKVRAISFDSSETSHGTTRSDKADVRLLESPPSPSSTASFPCELFIEAVGASRKAREQFVEVYNKARDELKNQRTSHIVSRVADKERIDTARLTSEQGACSSDVATHRPKRKSLETHQQEAQFQGKFKTLDGDSGPRFQYFGLNGIDQLASEQKGKIEALLEKKRQRFLNIHKAAGKAGPDVEICQHVQSPGVRAFGFPLNTVNSSLGDRLGQPATARISRHTKDFKKHNLLPIELNFRVGSKDSHRREMHQNKVCENNLEQRADAVVHVSCGGLRPEAYKCSHGQDFESNVVVKHYTDMTLTPQDVSLSKGLARVAGEADSVMDEQSGAFSLLGKRPCIVFEDCAVAGTCTCVAGKEPADSTEKSSSNIWLQRWHPTCLGDKCLEGHTHLPSNGIGLDPVGCVTLSMIKSKNFDGHSLHDRETEFKGSLKHSLAQDGRFVQKGEKEQGFKLQVQTEKVVPSASAMAIVGTAPRQFPYAWPEKKGSLAFWSGFGMPAIWKSAARNDLENA